MLLNEYVRSIIGDDRFQTKSELQIDVNLLSRLQTIIRASEEQIREWGAMLRWSHSLNRLVLDPGFPGQRTGVSWDQFLTAPPLEYIGTVHTHPYQKKLARDASVGFSIGDIVFYAENYPRHFPVGVNLVLSGDRVYFAIFREATRKHIGDDEKHALETDEAEADAHVLAYYGPVDGRRRLDDMQLRMWDAVGEGRIDDSGRIEREFFEAVPGYANVRMEANARMIRHAAAAIRFELYVGRLGGTAHLKSDRVYFAHGAKGWMQRNLRT